MEFVPPVWEPRAAASDLPAGAAHIWRLRTGEGDAREDRWKNLLNAGERERLGRFHFAADGRREAAGRGALRMLLGAYLGMASDAVAFAAEPRGKPVLADAIEDGRIEFNISHSGDWILLAFARGSRVGIDVEQWREIGAAEIARDFFQPEEVAEWKLWSEAERPAAFFGAWTLKEAYLKALGTGLSKSSRSFRVRIAPGIAPTLMECADDAHAPSRWQLARLEMAPGYSAAFAAERGIERVFSYTLSP